MISIDEKNRLITVNGKELQLGPTEFDILALLAKNPGKLLSRQQINKATRRDVPADSRLIDQVICRVRKKLGVKPSPIKTVQCYGYRYSK